MAGKLFVCATPIGNLDDITLRVLDTLKTADLIAAEDTRHTRGLLTHFDIHTPLTSYHEHNRFDKAEELIGKMLEGVNIALVTDAGTPGISDPGEVLIRRCIETGIEVTSLPGAAACITALTLSGMEIRRFCFEAFLPQKKRERADRLEELARETRTMVIYEAPHRLEKTLRELADAFGEDRPMSACRELTKIHESVVRGTIGEVCEYFDEHEPKGEFVLVVAGADPEAVSQADAESWEQMSLEEHLEYYMKRGLDKKAATKAVAADRGLSKRDVYNALL